MFLLAIDTSGKQGSIALADCRSDSACTVLEVMPLEGGTFSAQLVPQIASLLARHRLTKQDVGGFAAVSGPGSFTGLRVGLAAVKALAEVLGKPIATVSSLAAVGAVAQSPGRLMAALDAGRGEVFAAHAEMGDEPNEQVLSREEFLRAAAGFIVATPDQSVADLARGGGLPVEEVLRPRSDVVARLGWKKILAGNTVSPEQLEANYVRRADAEIFSKPA